MKKKYFFAIIAAILCAACFALVIFEGTTSKTKSHSFDKFTNLIGASYDEAVAEAETLDATFFGITFSPELLWEQERLGGVKLSAQLKDPQGEIATILWEFAGLVDNEYKYDVSSHENVYSDKAFLEQTKEEYLQNLETAIRKRGTYELDVTWDITRLASKQTNEFTAKMAQQAQKEDRETGFIWSVDERLEITLHATVMDAHKAELIVTCKAVAEPAAGLDMELPRSQRHQKFFSDSYKGLLQEENLIVTGYSFLTADRNTAQTLEEIWLHGADYLYITDNGISQKIYLHIEGATYRTTYRQGEYTAWEKLEQAIEHPLPWIDTDVETVFASGYGGNLSGSEYENAYTGAFEVDYKDGRAEFWAKANCVYKAEYRYTEETMNITDYATAEIKKAFEIQIVSEDEAKAKIEEYKKMLP